MMTLDEAIRHCEEVAEENEKTCEAKPHVNLIQYRECAEEHRQLAEWLKELKTRREIDHNMVKKIAESTIACGED